MMMRGALCVLVCVLCVSEARNARRNAVAADDKYGIEKFLVGTKGFKGKISIDNDPDIEGDHSIRGSPRRTGVSKRDISEDISARSGLAGLAGLASLADLSGFSPEDMKKVVSDGVNSGKDLLEGLLKNGGSVPGGDNESGDSSGNIGGPLGTNFPETLTDLSEGDELKLKGYATDFEKQIQANEVPEQFSDHTDQWDMVVAYYTYYGIRDDKEGPHNKYPEKILWEGKKAPVKFLKDYVDFNGFGNDKTRMKCCSGDEPEYFKAADCSRVLQASLLLALLIMLLP